MSEIIKFHFPPFAPIPNGPRRNSNATSITETLPPVMQTVRASLFGFSEQTTTTPQSPFSPRRPVMLYPASPAAIPLASPTRNRRNRTPSAPAPATTRMLPERSKSVHRSPRWPSQISADTPALLALLLRSRLFFVLPAPARRQPQVATTPAPPAALRLAPFAEPPARKDLSRGPRPTPLPRTHPEQTGSHSAFFD
jgi:hypothetical protein